MLSTLNKRRRRRTEGDTRGMEGSVEHTCRTHPRIPVRRRTHFSSGCACMLFVISGLLGGFGAGVTVANAQLTNGGAVVMDCGSCHCSGTSDDGTISVFDNPSSGERVRGPQQTLFLYSSKNGILANMPCFFFMRVCSFSLLGIIGSWSVFLHAGVSPFSYFLQQASCIK